MPEKVVFLLFFLLGLNYNKILMLGKVKYHFNPLNNIKLHIEKALKGDRIHQKAIYNMYRISLYKLCLLYVKEKSIAEDLLQEGFIKIFTNLSTYNPEKGTFTSWVRRIMINECLQYLRSQQRQFQVEELKEVIYMLNTRYEKETISKLSLEEMYKIINSLPEGYKIVFNLYIVEGYNHREISEMLGISESTSKSQLHKAKRKIKNLIKKYYPDQAAIHGRTAETYK